MQIRYSAEFKKSKLSIYWNNNLIHTGNDLEQILNVEVESDWNELVLECERLAPNENFGEVFLKHFLVDGCHEWPVDAGTDQIVVPFSTAHAYTYTESGNNYVAFNNTMFTNSYIRIYFKINNGIITDHYYDKGPDVETNRQSLKFLSLESGHYSLIWSDVYQAYVHRHMFTDHYVMIYNPKDRTTWGEKWYGPRFEYTDTALQEDLGREVNENFPWGATLGFDQSNELIFRKWPMYSVFGSFQYQTLPAKYLAPLLKRV